MYGPMYGPMYVCMYICMYVCMSTRWDGLSGSGRMDSLAVDGWSTLTKLSVWCCVYCIVYYLQWLVWWFYGGGIMV